jgi:hypothetical protein
LKILNYIFVEPRVVGKYGRKDIGGCWKHPKILLLSQQVPPKRTSWMLKILIFLKVKIKSYILELMQVEILISLLIYMIMNYQCLVITFEIIYSTLNILIFWPYVNLWSLVVWSNAKPKL